MDGDRITIPRKIQVVNWQSGLVFEELVKLCWNLAIDLVVVFEENRLKGGPTCENAKEQIENCGLGWPTVSNSHQYPVLLQGRQLNPKLEGVETSQVSSVHHLKDRGICNQSTYVEWLYIVDFPENVWCPCICDMLKNRAN